MNHKLFALFLSSLLLAACGSDPKSQTTGGTGDKPAAGAPMDDHGAPHPLGKVTVGTVAMTVTQFGDVVAGDDAAFDVEMADVTALPGAVRCWIGIETGVGSRKGKLDKVMNKLHGHVDVPDPIPAGSKFWIEMDLDAGAVRGSVALHQ